MATTVSFLFGAAIIKALSYPYILQNFDEDSMHQKLCVNKISYYRFKTDGNIAFFFSI